MLPPLPQPSANGIQARPYSLYYGSTVTDDLVYEQNRLLFQLHILNPDFLEKYTKSIVINNGCRGNGVEIKFIWLSSSLHCGLNDVMWDQTTHDNTI